LKCIYGVEAYYVDDIEDKSSRTMYHLILVAMTENDRRHINRIMSVANTDGYYYKPRIDLNLLLSLPGDEVVVTTACVAGRMFKNGKNVLLGNRVKEAEEIIAGYDAVTMEDMEAVKSLICDIDQYSAALVTNKKVDLKRFMRG
jgi:DNA polymerase III alpha subunit